MTNNSKIIKVMEHVTDVTEWEGGYPGVWREFGDFIAATGPNTDEKDSGRLFVWRRADILRWYDDATALLKACPNDFEDFWDTLEETTPAEVQDTTLAQSQ